MYKRRIMMAISFPSGDHALSVPSTPPRSPSTNEFAYFSDGHSPKDYEEEAQMNLRLNWRLQCKWEQGCNTPAFKLSSNELVSLAVFLSLKNVIRCQCDNNI